MFEFRVLGTVDLRGPDGRRIGSLLSQPKRLAFLAVLAMEAPRRLQRDELIGRLWPEMSEERARGALRQTLYYLRRSLGPGIVEGKGADDIGIAAGELECDGAELLRAAQEGRFEDALNLYEGEFLPGFHLDGGPVEFEHWLDATRRRIQRTVAEAARSVAEQELAAGNAVAAGVAGRRAWELGDWSEPAFQELLELLIRTGDASGARDAYQEFAERLQREHGSEPSAATRAILRDMKETVDATADRERRPSPVQPATAGDPPVPQSAAARPSVRRFTSWPAAAAFLAALVVATWALLPRAEDGVLEAAVSIGEATPSLYLEPVRDFRPSARFPAMAEAITRELAARLSETDGFVVVALAQGERSAVGGHGIRLRPTLRDVEGEVQLSVLFIDPTSDAVLDQLTVSTAEEVRSIPVVLAGRMAPQIRQEAGELLSLQGLADRGIAPDALRAVREAAAELEAANKLRVRGAEEAAALAYAATDSLLRRAADLEPTWPEPTLRRAEVRLRTMWLYMIPPDHRPDMGHREILRGLAHATAGVAIDPGHARAREVRGVLLYWAGTTASDNDQKSAYKAEAEAELEEAVRRDAGLPRAWSILSALAEDRGDFAVAYHRARRAYVTDHDLQVPIDILARLFTNALEVGDARGAAEWCAEIRRRESDQWLGPYCDLTRLAWVGPWTVAASDSLLEEGLRLLPTNGRGGHTHTRFKLLHAVVLAKAGETGAARELLATVADPRPASLEVLELQAWVRSALGEKARARKLLVAAAELNQALAPRVLRSRRYSDLSTYALVGNDR